MPLFDKLKSSTAKDSPSEKRETKEDIPPPNNSREEAPPSYAPTDIVPGYAPTDPISEAAAADLNSAFSNLNIAPTPSPFPEPDHCLVHLKFLFALHGLKQEYGYADGLFGIRDSSCEKAENKAVALAALREKRWSLFVARAAERFQEWWLKVLCTRENGEKVTCKALGVKESFMRFPELGKAQVWTTAMLPPLDVLMVWHTFMLNPRSYLEDCARLGLKDLWATGMPWAAVNSAIDSDFSYNVPELAKTSFMESTGLNWDNADDSVTKVLKCPRCNQANEIPWTTVGANGYIDFEEMKGSGYGDRDFAHACIKCQGNINHRFLRVHKFIKDTEGLILNDYPLGGTILSSDGGLAPDKNQTGFVNRLFQVALRVDVLELMEKHEAPTMVTIQGLIERAIQNKPTIRQVNENGPATGSTMTKVERASIRRMMARYWDNSSVFSLELGSAVIRQGIFVDKMQKLDWLHSPAARDTMQRLLIKYGRFIKIMAAYPREVAVPTLDVDLGWHTHQLSPQQYYDYTMEKCRQFIDHDDKITEDRLSKYFEWTSETYQNTYKEVYSECTCWYCESIRARHNSAKFFGATKLEKPVDDWYKSGAAKFCFPSNSAHISAHNSVRVEEIAIRKQVFDRLRERDRRALEAAYLLACKKAEQKGRKKPEKGAYYYDHWGSPLMMAAPFIAVPVLVGGFYYAGETFSIPQGSGMEGACAAGTCGAGVGGSPGDGRGGYAGGCGGSGGCGGGGGGGGCGGGGG